MNKKYIPEIIYEDNHLIVVNKPAKMLVQGDYTGDLPIVEHIKLFLKEKYNKQGKVFCGLPHRLDRPTSGVLVLAKTSKALSRLSEQFKEKEMEKIYWAVTKERPPEVQDTLTHFLVKNQKKNKSFAYPKDRKNAKKAMLNYTYLGTSDRYHLIEIELLTGRHHQIRVQLSKIGCPIRGDIKYGYDRTNKDGSIHLHARQITLIHPVQKEPFTFVARPPKDPIWDFFVQQNLGKK